MKNTCPFHISWTHKKVRFIKTCKLEPQDLLFLVVFISFYISRYHFSQIFRNSFNIICKKDFRHELSFLTDSLKFPLHSLNGQNPLRVTKVFCRYSLKRQFLYFLLVLCGSNNEYRNHKNIKKEITASYSTIHSHWCHSTQIVYSSPKKYYLPSYRSFEKKAFQNVCFVIVFKNLENSCQGLQKE